MLINPKQPIIRQIREGEYEYQADLYDAKVFFNDPQADDHNHLMRIVKYDNELIFKMLNASPTNITVDKDNQLTYHNVFEGVDTVYTLYPDKVKEDIIINSPEAEHVFKFRVYESLPATMQDSGDIFYCDNENQNVFELPAPYATDTNNNTVDVEMIHEEGYYTYKVIPDKDTVYPIILDPTVQATINAFVINISASGAKYNKSDSKTFYFEDNITKPKSMKFITRISRKAIHNNYTAKINIIVYDKNNTELEKIERINGSNGDLYYTIDIPDEAHHIYFYCSALNATDNMSSAVGMSVACGISSVTYDDEDNIFIQSHPALSLIANTQKIYTLTNTNTLPTANISKLSFFAEDSSCITIDSVTINDQIVDKDNFSIKPNDEIKIALTSTKKQILGYITFIKMVGTQEHQLLNINEEIIPSGHELLSMNENTIEVGNNQFNLEECIANGGNPEINTKEVIYASESSKLSTKINVDTSLRKNIPVYTNQLDSCPFVERTFNTELANYIKILGCTVSSRVSYDCVYTDYNDNNHYFSISSEEKKYISDSNGIKDFWGVHPDNIIILIHVDDVTVDRLDANFEPDFFVYGNTSITFEDEHIVKIVNGDIYELIDPDKGSIPSNLIPLRDTTLVRTDKTYYIKCDKYHAVGVFRYEDNVTIEDSLLSMNEKIVDTPNIELIENIYATEKSGIQTKEYIINGNGYQYINTEELIYANESELLSINENTVEVGNNQFNLEENIVNGGNPEINIKEVISADESSELSIKINVDTALREGIPVFTDASDSHLLVKKAFDSELANYFKIVGFTVSSSASYNCVYYDYNDNKYPFSVSSTNKTYISDSNGIKSFREDPIDSSIKLRVDDVAVEKLDVNLEPDFFAYGDIRITFENDYIVKIVNGDIYEVINPNKGNYSSNLIPLGRNKVLLRSIRSDKLYYIKHEESLAVCVFRYDNAAIENSLLSMNEKIFNNNATIEDSLLPMNEKICYESNVKLIENICTTKKSEIQIMEHIIKDNEYQLLNVKEEIMYSGQELAGNDQFNLEEYVAKGGNSDIINTKETISINSSDIFDINEKIYGIEKEEIPLIEKITSDANSDLITIKELVSTPDNTVIDIKENIKLASDLNIIEKVFVKDSILLPITEGITTENDSLIRILENVKNSSEDRFDIKEYIATGIGEEKLDIIEKITISDETVINIIENIVIDGYSCIPIEENIVINGNDKIDINEIIVEKAAEEIVLLEEVKILGNDTVSIIENVKPVSLTIVENIRREVDYATRLITFTKPTFTYKKGK